MNQVLCRNSKQCRPSGSAASAASSRSSSRWKFGGSCQTIGPSFAYGWPTPDNPYAQPSAYTVPDVEQVLLHLYSQSAQ